MALKENEFKLYFFQEFIEKLKSYRNILLCTQNIFLIIDEKK